MLRLGVGAIGLTLLLLVVGGPERAAGPTPVPGVAKRYAALPLAYERAGGASPADFVARGAGYSAFVRRAGARLAIGRGRRGLALDIGLAGAHAGAPRPVGRLAGRVNVLRPGHLRTNVPTFSGVRYPHAWPGTDVVYHGRQGAFEYDFDLRPGADPGAVALRLRGQSRLRLGNEGDLVVSGAGQRLRQAKPLAFQTVGGTRRSVSSRYVRRAGGTIGIAVGAYDRSRALTIDPLVVGYSTFLGASGGDSAEGIAVDSSGAAYVAGATSSTAFPTTAGAYDTSENSGSTDAFVTKINAAGTGLVYSTFIGGGGQDLIEGIAVDGSGAAYLSGDTTSTDFPTVTAYQASNKGGNGDAFVAKLNATGTGLVYSTYLGGTGIENGFGSGDLGNTHVNRIAVDASGAAYVTGQTKSADFPTTAGAYDTTYGGADFFFGDLYVAKLGPAGGLTYSTFLGGASGEEDGGIAVDGSGSAYVSGLTRSDDFPTTAGAFDTSVSPGGDAFVTKLNPSGTGLAYSTLLGGSARDGSAAIAVDAAGAAYVVGDTASSDFPATAGTYAPTYTNPGGDTQLFVAKVGTAGTVLTYATYLGGSGTDLARGIAVDPAGDAYAVGDTASSDFPTVDASDSTPGGEFDGFVTELNPSGSNLCASTLIGGAKTDEANGVAVGSGGTAYVSGLTLSGDLPTTAGAFDTTFDATQNGFPDAYVAKLTGFTCAGSTTPAPETTITGGPADGATVTTPDVTYSFSASEAGATFACSVDGGTAASCTSPTTLRKLAAGRHTFTVAATGAGGTDASPATRSVTVSAVPAAPTTSPTPGTTSTPTPTPVAQPVPKLSVKIRPRRDRRRPFRFTVKGKLTLPAGVPASAGCTGKVSVSVKRGKKARGTRKTKLRKACTFKLRRTFKTAKRLGGRKGRLKFTVRFAGNGALAPAKVTRSVKYG